jgi:hypothetical protein
MQHNRRTTSMLISVFFRNLFSLFKLSRLSGLFNLFRLLSLFSLLSLFFPLASYAWNATGHMVVANIAYQNLKPQVREKVDSLVNVMHQQYPKITNFMDLAAWPDTLHGQKIETYSRWHYIDTAISLDGTQTKNLIDTDNAVWALKNIQEIVKNPQANIYERVRFLSFLAHITGDLHQPLHTVSYMSANFPDGDKGGNMYFVQYNHGRSNLHSLWDRGVGEFEAKPSSENIKLIANRIMTAYPENYFGNRINVNSPQEWANEGVKNAKEFVYNTPQNQALSNDYLKKGKELADQQAALAGYRLAKFLNQLMD